MDPDPYKTNMDPKPCCFQPYTFDISFSFFSFFLLLTLLTKYFFSCHLKVVAGDDLNQLGLGDGEELVPIWNIGRWRCGAGADRAEIIDVVSRSRN